LYIYQALVLLKPRLRQAPNRYLQPFPNTMQKMNSEKIIEKAKQLIETSKQDFASKTNAEKYFWFDNEYYLLYEEAIQLLLENGYIENNDLKIQKAFLELIPEPEIFIENKLQFDNLFSSDEQLKISSAKHFSKLARGEGTFRRELLFMYPKTFQLLIPALNDTNLKVVRDIIISLGCAYQRFFKDPRVEKELYKFYNHKDKEILYYAIIWTSKITKEDKFDYIFSLLESKQTSKILEALCQHFREDTKTEIKIKTLPILIDSLDRKLPSSTKNKLIKTIIYILDDSTIELFNSKLNLNNDNELKELFVRQMNLHCLKERIDYLTNRIL